MAGGMDPADAPPTKLHLQPVSPVLRRCYLNMEYVNPRNGAQIPVRKVTSTSGSAGIVLETQFPHNASAFWKDYVEIKGASNSAYNGRFRVTAPFEEDPLSRTL